MPRSRSIAAGAKLDLAADLAQQEQAFVDARRLVLGQIELVDGLVEFGGGVGVGAEAQAEPLEPVDELALGDVGRAVERHMLDEVGEAALVVALLERAGVDPQPERGLVRRRGVVAQRVAHAVGQGAEAHVGIGRQVAPRLRPRDGRRARAPARPRGAARRRRRAAAQAASANRIGRRFIFVSFVKRGGLKRGADTSGKAR